MNIYYGIESIERIKKDSVMTLGSFDGVHAGHTKVFDFINKIAKENDKHSLVITFDPHPRVVINNIKEDFLLTTIEEKIKLIEEKGIDDLLIIKFDKSFAKINAEEFINSIVINMIKPSHIVVGYDTHFGNNRMGDLIFLKKVTARKNIKIDIVEQFLINNEPVSSSEIRKLLKFGNIKKANKLLNYSYFFKGKVIRGEGRGALLGFPTANLECFDELKLLPQKGVYIVNVVHNNKNYKGIMNIGNRPTFDNNEELTIEVHLLKFSDNLYSKILKVHVSDRIRDEIKFENKEQLIEQLKEDINKIKHYKEDTWH